MSSLSVILDFLNHLSRALIQSGYVLLLQAHLSSCTDKERGSQERLIEPLMSLVKSYEGGRESHARVIVQSLFEEYLSVEELFSDQIQVILFLPIASW